MVYDCEDESEKNYTVDVCRCEVRPTHPAKLDGLEIRLRNGHGATALDTRAFCAYASTPQCGNTTLRRGSHALMWLAWTIPGPWRLMSIDETVRVTGILKRRLESPEKVPRQGVDRIGDVNILYNPAWRRMTVGPADSIRLALSDDFDPIHQITAEVVPPVEKYILAFCPTLSSLWLEDQLENSGNPFVERTDMDAESVASVRRMNSE